MDIETPARPGRPTIGPMITLRVTPDDLELVDHAAQVEGISRAEWLRRAARDRLAMDRASLAAFVEWLIREGVGGAAPGDPGLALEIREVIETPENYEDWYQLFRSGRSIDDGEEQESK